MKKITIKRIVLVVLLVILAVLYRVQYKYPHHPDHYALGQYTYALVDRGYAPWVLHPTSLFGYYPLSVPSGLEFFFAFLSSITGLGIPTLFYYFSIFSGLFAGLSIFMLMRKWTPFYVSFITSFVLLTMTFFALDTSNTASSRIFNIMLYPPFILLLFNAYEHKRDRKRMVKYLLSAFLVFMAMALIHRIAQLALIFVISFILAIVVIYHKRLLEVYKKSFLYKIRKKNYSASRLHILIDVTLVLVLLLGFRLMKDKIIFLGMSLAVLFLYFAFSFRKNSKARFFFIPLYLAILGTAKALDLFLRDRLLAHIGKYIILAQQYSTYLIIGAAIILLVMILVLLFIRKLVFRLISRTGILMQRLGDSVVRLSETNPDKAISIGLFLVFSLLISMTFISGGFFKIDSSYYEDSFLLKGKSAPVILFNYLFNLNNNLTVLIWFAAFGIIYLFFTRHKTFYHFFFMFVCIFFSQFIFDWEYVRLFMNPIYAIIIGLGLAAFTSRIINSRFRTIAAFLLVLFVGGHFLVSNIFMHREEFISRFDKGRINFKIPEELYIGAGDYLLNKGEEAVYSSSSYVRVSILAYYARKPEAFATQSIYLQSDLYNISKFSFSDIVDDVKKGRKIRQFFELQDWIFGSNYYSGRHIFYLGNHNFLDPFSVRILKDYKIKYIADSPQVQEKSELFESVVNLKNKLYSNPMVDIYDINKGRA